MVNEGIGNEIRGGLPGSIIRMRASLGILSNPKTAGKEPIYGTVEQDKLEIEMGNLARQFLSKDLNNKIRCILHINPDLQLKKGYKRAALVARLEAIREFIESFPGQIDIAHSPIPTDLNHVIVAENVSYITLQQAREIGYQRIHMKQNRWIVRSEIDNFDNDFDSLQLFNSRLALQLGIDVAATDWSQTLSLFIIRNAIALLSKDSGTVLQSNKQGDIIQPVSRSLAHSNGILHKSVHLHLIEFGETRKSVWLQRRTKSKDLWEGMIDVAVAGHPETSNQLFEVLREAAEELGIWLNPNDVIHLYQYPRKLQEDDEIIDVYYADTKNYSDIGLKFKSEVDSIMRVNLDGFASDPIEAQGYVSYGSMKLPALFRLSVAEFTPGLLSELRELNEVLSKIT
jgi:isopentenyldiphosphate isomerase